MIDKDIGSNASLRLNIDRNDRSFDDFGSQGFNIDIGKYLNIAARWWWFIALSIIVAACVGYFVAKNTVPTYRSLSVIEIKQKEANILDVSGVEEIVANSEYVTTQISLLQSRTLMERVVLELGMYKNPANVNMAASRQDRIDQAVNSFKSNLRVNPLGRSRLVNITYTSSSPELAAKAVNSLTKNFINYNYERSYGATAEARDFVERRLEEAKKTLGESERRLTEYTVKEDLIETSASNEGGGGSESIGMLKLLSAIEEHAKADQALLELRASKGHLLNLSSDQIFVKSEALISLEEKRRSLEIEYGDQLLIYKPRHPIMLAIQAKIDEITKQISDEDSRTRDKLQSEYNQAVAIEQSKYDQAVAIEAELSKRVELFKDQASKERKSKINYNILVREVETDRAQFEGLLARLKELNLSYGIGPNLISIVDAAKIPKSPYKPDYFLILLFSVLSGALISLGVVTLLEIVNNKFTTPNDVSDRLKIPLLGVFPSTNTNEVIQNLNDPLSGISEAYSSTRSAILTNLSSNHRYCIQITSTRSKEGKSSVAYGLAKSFADMGKQVLLIDADMRKPAFKWNKNETVGLTGVILEEDTLLNSIAQTKIPSLFLLSSGKQPINPTTVILSEGFKRVISEAKEKFDLIFIDSPPTLGLADAPSIGANCDFSIYVVESNSISTQAVKASLARMMQSKVNILGVVLNKYTPPRSSYSDYNYYSYGYSAYNYNDSDRKKPRKGLLRKLLKPARRKKIDITDSDKENFDKQKFMT